tara:strand:+ start:60 stop:488 length:429 start_codon:yes stop_codon:yes gene_type:complete
MIIYSVKGKSSKKFDRYIQNCLNHLIPYPIEKDVDLLIRFKKHLKNENTGQAIGDTNEVTVDIARFQELDDGTMKRLTLNEMAQNLAHELVHAKQFILGEINSTDYIWKKIDYSECNYWEQPWEVEAYHREDYLYKTFWSEK